MLFILLVVITIFIILSGLPKKELVELPEFISSGNWSLSVSGGEFVPHIGPKWPQEYLMRNAC